MNDRIIAIVSTILIHLALIVIALFYQIDIIPEKVKTRVEILDFRVMSKLENSSNELKPMKSAGEPQIKSFNTGSKNDQTPKLVDLPKSAYDLDIPNESVEIPVESKSAQNQIKMNEIIGNTHEEAESNISQDAVNKHGSKIEEKPFDVLDDSDVDDLFSVFNEDGEKVSPFKIAGEIQQREIITKVIPNYPEGMQKNAVIEIKISVEPNGNVKDLLVIKKADPALEKLSLDALKQWKFNQIAVDKIETGVVTFVFELE